MAVDDDVKFEIEIVWLQIVVYSENRFLAVAAWIIREKTENGWQCGRSQAKSVIIVNNRLSVHFLNQWWENHKINIVDIT